MPAQSPDAKYRQMIEDPIPRLICTLAVPTIISMLITSVYNMADTFFVGKIGTSATGAVGVVFSLMAIFQAVGFTFGIGSGNLFRGCWVAVIKNKPSTWQSPGFTPPLRWGCC